MARYVYRIIRNDENIKNGLWARGNDYDISAERHVAHSPKNSPWISLTCSPSVALKYNLQRADKYGICRIIAIDIDKIDVPFENCMNRTDWTNIPRKYGVASQELLILDYIPERAITTTLLDINDIKEIDKRLTKEDLNIYLSVLEDIGQKDYIAYDEFNRPHKFENNDFPHLKFVNKYNDLIDKGEFSYSLEKQKRSIMDYEEGMYVLSKNIDLAMEKYLNDGNFEKAKAAFLVFSKIEKQWSSYMIDFFREPQNEIKQGKRVGKNVMFQYASYESEMAKELKQKNKSRRNLKSKSVYDFYKKEADAIRKFDSISQSLRKRYMEPIDCGDGVISVVGEQKYLQLLLNKYGGEIYDNGHKWIGYADKENIGLDCKRCINAEKELAMAAKEYKTKRDERMLEKYQEKHMNHDNAFNIKYSDIPNDLFDDSR